MPSIHKGARDVQHSGVYALAHHRTDTLPLNEPDVRTECIAVLGSVCSALASSFSRSRLRSPNARSHARPQRISFCCAYSYPLFDAVDCTVAGPVVTALIEPQRL